MSNKKGDYDNNKKNNDDDDDDEECRQRLLAHDDNDDNSSNLQNNTSNLTNVTTINEKIPNGDEPPTKQQQSSARTSRKRFVVTKLDEPIAASDTNVAGASTNESQLQIESSVSNSNSREYDSPGLLPKTYLDDDDNDYEGNDDDDDLFESKEKLAPTPMLEGGTAMADESFNQRYRESEGQDTVTSLTNNIYRRQMLEIKRKGALIRAKTNEVSKSRSGSVKSTSDGGSTPSRAGTSSNEHIEILKSLIDSKESVVSKKAMAILNAVEKAAAQMSVSSLETTGGGASVAAASSSSPSPLLPKSGSQRSSLNNLDLIVEAAATAHSTNKTHHTSAESLMQHGGGKSNKKISERQARLEMLQSVLEDDFDIFATIYREHYRKEIAKTEKTKHNAKCMCLVLEIFVFVGVLILTVVFTRSVYYHLEIIWRIPQVRSSSSSSSWNSTNNLTESFSAPSSLSSLSSWLPTKLFSSTKTNSSSSP